MQTTRPEVGDQVTVLWNGEEYKCTVKMVEDTRVKVHYKGNNAGHDQWVPLSKPGGGAVAVRKDLVQLHKQHKSKPVVGEEVTVLWNSEEYKCTVKMVEDTRVKVNYKGYNADHDQWVLLSKQPGDFFKDLESWTRKDLAEKCQNLGLSDKGTKTMMVESLKKLATQKNN